MELENTQNHTIINQNSSQIPPPDTPPTVTRFIPYGQSVTQTAYTQPSISVAYNPAMYPQYTGVVPVSYPYDMTTKPFVAYQQTQTFPSTQQYITPGIQQYVSAATPAVNQGQPLTDNPIWLTYYISDGTPYYYNKVTGETMWDKPSTAPKIEHTLQTAILNRTPGSNAVDKTKPVSKSLVSGTNWSIVWTGDDRMFFFNVVEKRSVWNCPEDLKGRKDVIDLMENKPKIEGNEIPIELHGDSTDSNGKRMGDPEGIDENSGSKRVVEESNKSDVVVEEEKKVSNTRSTLPYSERVDQFRELLLEKNVSTSSTFEKELQKIVFDKRYTLLLSKERRQVYDQFVKERIEDERIERARQHKKRREDFKELMKEASLGHRASYSEFASRYSREPRFQGIDRTRDRETLFYDFVGELKRKRDKNSERGGKTKEFVDLLKESNVTVGDRWRDVKRRIESDPRYKAISSSDRRGDIFADHVQSLTTSPRKSLNVASPNEEGSTEVEDEDAKRREKEERSLLEREMEVKQARTVAMQEIDKGRRNHQTEEVKESFRILLTDLVKSTRMELDEALCELKKDSRWAEVSDLDRGEMDTLYSEHQRVLSKKNKAVFYTLLAETSEIKLSLPWREAKRYVRDDPRYSKFSSSDRKREKAFDTFMKEKTAKAKSDVRELFKETRLITYKTKQLIQDGEDDLANIDKILQNDARYLELDCYADERKKMLEEYIADLDKRGPPPPPTQTDPATFKR